MDLDKESLKHLKRLCESVLWRYDVADKAQLRNVLQRELSVTLDRVLDSNSLAPSYDPRPEPGVYVMTAPLNSLFDVLWNKQDGKVSVYLKFDYTVQSPDVTMGDQGEEFLNTKSEKEYADVFLGDILADGNNLNFRLNDAIPAELVDINLYSSCWKTSDEMKIVNFLNDIYNKIYSKGIHTLPGLSLYGDDPNRQLITNVSYRKLLGYAKEMFPNTFGNEAFILQNVLRGVTQADIGDVIINKPEDAVSFTVVCDDNDKGAIDWINSQLAEFV